MSSIALSPHAKAILQALLVTFLWSSSWVFIKFGLEDIPALTFAGLRYFFAFLILLVLFIGRRQVSTLRQLEGRDWIRLTGLGIIFYSITQATQFLGLSYLPAITANLLMSFTTIVTTVMAIFFLAEHPRRSQWLGMAIYLMGVMVFFYPINIPTQEMTGLFIIMIGVVSNALATILGRAINRTSHLPTLTVTVVSMGIGSILLLTAGLITQGLPSLSLNSWAIILWLAVVNTAFAFTLWNVTLRTLSAMESSIINNAMLIQIPIFALIFLGESISLQKLFGMVTAGIGILTVQGILERRRKLKKAI